MTCEPISSTSRSHRNLFVSAAEDFLGKESLSAYRRIALSAYLSRFFRPNFG